MNLTRQEWADMRVMLTSLRDIMKEGEGRIRVVDPQYSSSVVGPLTQVSEAMKGLQEYSLTNLLFGNEAIWSFVYPQGENEVQVGNFSIHSVRLGYNRNILNIKCEVTENIRDDFPMIYCPGNQRHLAYFVACQKRDERGLSDSNLSFFALCLWCANIFSLQAKLVAKDQ